MRGSKRQSRTDRGRERERDSLIMSEKGIEIVIEIWKKTEEKCGLIYGRARVTF